MVVSFSLLFTFSSSLVFANSSLIIPLPLYNHPLHYITETVIPAFLVYLSTPAIFSAKYFYQVIVTDTVQQA